jgi:hypothetical protein
MAAKFAQLPNNSTLTQTADESDLCRPQQTVLAKAISAALIAGRAAGDHCDFGRGDP